jgi:hypothetical protein
VCKQRVGRGAEGLPKHRRAQHGDRWCVRPSRGTGSRTVANATRAGNSLPSDGASRARLSPGASSRCRPPVGL